MQNPTTPTPRHIDAMRNEWNLTDPTTDGRSFEQYVADETVAAEALRVSALFVDLADTALLDPECGSWRHAA